MVESLVPKKTEHLLINHCLGFEKGLRLCELLSPISCSRLDLHHATRIVTLIQLLAFHHALD